MNMFPAPGPLKIFPVEEQNANHAALYLGVPWKQKTEGQRQLTEERRKPTSFRQPRKGVTKSYGGSECFVLSSAGTVKRSMVE